MCIFKGVFPTSGRQGIMYIFCFSNTNYCGFLSYFGPEKIKEKMNLSKLVKNDNST